MGLAGLRLGASLLTTLLLALALSVPLRAADYDYPEDNDRGRLSTWELDTSLTFYRYFEPFPRLDSAHACRDRCVYDHRCTGWTYYDANFHEAGPYSYKLQRVCVLGAGLRDRQTGNRPGRTSGVVRSHGYNHGDD